MIDNETIGVGITTRNRSEVLDACLRHFDQFSTIVDRLVVVDDNSEETHRERLTTALTHVSIPHVLRSSDKRLGISKAKNACLAALQDCDHVFLFDDDAWPQKEGWEEYWIKCSKVNKIGHSMWLCDYPGLNTVIRKTGTVGSGTTEMSVFNNCLGVALYFSRNCLQALGGYDTSAENVYGYEHAQMSTRAKQAGFTYNNNYVAPSNCAEYVYSIDISWGWMQKNAPLTDISAINIQSSVSVEESNKHNLNSRLMSFSDYHRPLIDPFEEQ